jgi:cysteine desulfurase
VGGFRGSLGGEQEGRRRAGTENFPGIAAMVAALSFAESQETKERTGWRDEFITTISKALPGVRVNGGGAPRLWNTVSLCMPEHENTRWVTRLDKAGFQVSTGSACATGSSSPSHVLAAMGLGPEEARRTIRVSAGWETACEDWDALAEVIIGLAGGEW